jgi:hypothetical protein
MSDTPAPPPLQSQTSSFKYNLSNPNEHLQLFYAAIGVCIKELSSIEHVLLQLCNLALKTTDKIASIVYLRTPSLESRTNLTEELLLAILPQRERKNGGHDHRLVKEWIVIRKGIKSELEVRNKLAHWPLAMSVDMKVTTEPPSGTFSLTSTPIITMSPGERANPSSRIGAKTPIRRVLNQ